MDAALPICRPAAGPQWAHAAGLIVALSLFGCDGDGLQRATVRGTVTVDGQPLQSGSIALLPQPGTKGPSVGGAIESGSYVLAGDSGPVRGSYRVEIRATRKTGRQVRNTMRPPPDNLVDEIE